MGTEKGSKGDREDNDYCCFRLESKAATKEDCGSQVVNERFNIDWLRLGCCGVHFSCCGIGNCLSS